MAYKICMIYCIVVLIYIKGVHSALYCGNDLCEHGCCYDEETTRTFYCCPEETSLSPGVIIGIIIASAFGLCLMGCLCAWTRKVLQKNKDIPYVSLRGERQGYARSTNEQNTRDSNERNQPDDSRTSERFVYIRLLIDMFLHPIDGYNKSVILAQRKLSRLKYQMLRAQVKLVRRSNADRIIEIKGKFTGVVTDDSVLDKITVSSLVECAVSCRASDQCQSYFWNSLLSECQRQLTLYTTSVDLHEYRPGNTYFVSEDNLVKATGESLKDSLCKGAGYNMSDTGIMCYQIENRKQNYVTASRQCVNESGHLVRVDSTEKFDDIEAVVLGEEAGFRILVDGRYSSGRVWKFSDGSLMTILDFVLDQPDSSMQDDKDSSKQNEEDSSNEDCIVLVYNSGMVRMDHVSCNEQFTFICEIELF